MGLAWLLLAGGVALLLRSDHTVPLVGQAMGAASLDPQGHGLQLAAAKGESVARGAACPNNAPVRSYEVAAIKVEITLNRYLDYDPDGRMFALAAEIPRVKAEEQGNAAARYGVGGPAVSLGLQGDAIQPLTLRVNQGECLRITLRNELGEEPASLHLHGSSLHMLGSTRPAIATEPTAMAGPGQQVAYEWWVDAKEPEGTHHFHSHGDERFQTGHGLFGAVIVEPAKSRFLDPLSGGTLNSGWAAVIDAPAGAFREFALYYHEIGDENYQPLNKEERTLPQVDGFTGAYRPASRALNYRSEPFMNRLALQVSQSGVIDESLAYSSYTYGDPATPILRSYVGDRVKERVIHGGSEVFHVHHVHGGSIRWAAQPGASTLAVKTGLDKHPPLLPQVSQVIDSQSLGPSETFDVENQCGAGGCQQSVGDFLIHCHIAQHYFAGMWGIWRVYNTLQNGAASTDALPPLGELPGRVGQVRAAVDSTALAGRSVEWSGLKMEIQRDGVAAWVERLLPPAGRPKGYDASVLDWRREGELYLNEPETTTNWPGFASARPGQRIPIKFDPITGKLAYPFLSPHLGKRPPFAPNHGPAPYLDPQSDGLSPPAPGANGPASLCPTGTKPKQFNLQAITVPITLNQAEGLVDPAGQLFVLKSQEAEVRAANELRTPLAIRANAGEDCVDVLLRSELVDESESHFFSKVNAHIHFAQFDVQASDGVVTGFNYEQSVRPFKLAGEALTLAVATGDQTLRLSAPERFQPGIIVGIGMDEDETFEVARIAAISGDEIRLEQPLRFGHTAGAYVSTEFVRYRWYPDMQFGTAYFHDHVNALNSWRHGLYGALIGEPPGSTYHDPETGQTVSSGLVCDIRTTGQVSVDVKGSFREAVLFLQDDSPLTRVGRSTGGLLNLRAEPLERRGGDLSGPLFGEPATTMVRARRGDPVVLRTLVGGTNEVHTLHVDGHWFRAEPFSVTSPPINTVQLGISERQEIVIPKAGGIEARAGDYLFYDGRASKLSEGMWGLLRVLEENDAGLQRLPGREPLPAPPASVCPPRAPQRRFAVSAIGVPLPMLDGGRGKVYVLDRDREAVRGGGAPAPLVLHVNVGECVKIDLHNETDGPVSFRATGLSSDPRRSGATAPNGTRSYEFFAAPELGEMTALVRDDAQVTVNPALGLYGAIVVGPAGARYRDPGSGEEVAEQSAWQVVVTPREGRAYRDFTLFFQDGDDSIGTHRMPYTTRVQGAAAINYQREPFAGRLSQNRDPSLVFSQAIHGQPATPVLEARVGDAVKLHVLSPASEQAQVFSIEGHRWEQEPGLAGTTLLSAAQLGAMSVLNVTFEGGAGGVAELSGEYIYGNHRQPYQEAGMWGIFRVLPQDAEGGVQPIAEKESLFNLTLIGLAIGIGLIAGMGLGYLQRWRKRRRVQPQGQGELEGVRGWRR